MCTSSTGQACALLVGCTPAGRRRPRGKGIILASEAASREAGRLTDVPGLRVGHAQDPEGITGCTVVLCEGGFTVAGDVRGGWPGTRETDLLHPDILVQEAHAVLLGGGSAFGLAAAEGVMAHLQERGVGIDTHVARMPIVPAAVMFDLPIGRPDAYPSSAMGRKAAEEAATDFHEGSVGAGMEATVGKFAGLARSIFPVHTLFDGDSVFALASGDAQTEPSIVGGLGGRRRGRSGAAGSAPGRTCRQHPRRPGTPCLVNSRLSKLWTRFPKAERPTQASAPSRCTRIHLRYPSILPRPCVTVDPLRPPAFGNRAYQLPWL